MDSGGGDFGIFDTDRHTTICSATARPRLPTQRAIDSEAILQPASSPLCEKTNNTKGHAS